MSRATVWPPLCEVDPVPGDPDTVTRAGRRYSEMAKEIEDQVRRLNGLVSGTLQGGYVRSLTKAAEGLKADLGLTSKRYREVGGALQKWAPQLGEFQDEAEWLRRSAVTAQGEMSANQAVRQPRAVEGAPRPAAEVAAAKAAANARQGRFDDASGNLSNTHGQLDELTDRRNAKAAEIADAIRATCDDAVANSAWDSFKDWMDDHHELVSTICNVLGVIAMVACVVALFVPGLNVLAVGVLVAATSASLVGHTMLASTDHGSWWAVGLDAFNLATMGAAGLAAKAAGKAAAQAAEQAAAKGAEQLEALTLARAEQAAERAYRASVAARIRDAAEAEAEEAAAFARVEGTILEVNPHGGVTNCVNCAIATDSWLAGVRVAALPSGPKPTWVLENHFGAKFEFVYGRSPERARSEIADRLAHAGPGARGIVRGYDKITEMGHVFNAANVNGQIRFLDGQSGGPASFLGFDWFEFLRTG